MSIFNINNRSESWRISRQFILGGYGLSNKLANKVVSNVGQELSGEVELELFWTGFRDYCHSQSITLENKSLLNEVGIAFEKNFSTLFEQVESFNKRNTVKLRIDSSKHNYRLNNQSLCKLVKNLYHTEIDIVISTGNSLLVGEVKSEVSFNANSEYVLVHQLIRQYVMATILVHLLNINGQNITQITPFVIAEKNVSRSAQVRFMIDSGWLHQSNIFDWSVLEEKVS
ncbi:hypothetical protein DXX93_13735 [Thalassotalea euphylliae]|uniref:Uncharacterized protein n=1 Tax=Thalassotalea euphylliae TaxID=1655234 RepID=A0A3E0TSQ2_9GAMM|nr:hypothetical protein [Thalassotalea euphylliae]REL27514.1 hypothetical protein DXX93_13735 [Thalassotalea euphylliae]